MTDVLPKGNVQLQKFIVQWKINRFFADCQQVGNYYKSSALPIEYPNKTTKWHLIVYPQGDKEENKNYVSLFLNYISEIYIELSMNCRFSMLGKLDNEIAMRSGKASPKGYQDSKGWTRFIDNSALNKGDVMSDDSLTIMCEVKFNSTDKNIEDSFHGYDEWLDKTENPLGNYEEFLESGNFSDVTFNILDQKINLHKVILSCRSPVFKAMFEHDMKENKQNSVDVTDIDYDIMKELFRFIYLGKVKDIDDIASDLLIAADKYQVIELKALCEKTLYQKLTIDNALDYLKLTDSCDTLKLKTLVIEFIGTHFKDVVKKPGFEDLNNKMMFQIMLAAAEKH